MTNDTDNRDIAHLGSRAEAKDMVMVPREDAEWLRTWKGRCQESGRFLGWFWKAVLGALGAIGMGLYVWNQLVQALSEHATKLTGH